MAPGSHTLELATFVVDGGVFESGRSAALRVLVSPATVSSRAESWRTDQLITTADNIQLRLELIANGLDDPTDMGFVPDGRVLVAERSGRIHIVRDGQLQTSAALDLDLGPFGERRQVLVDTAATGEGGLLALAVDPQFQRTGFVYVIYAAPTPDGSAVFRLARFREAHGTFAERAILLDNVPAPAGRPAASLRFGSDQKLYAVFDDGGDAKTGGDLASYGGKILRLNPDGTTPQDQPGGSPLYADAVRSPRGMDWQPATGALWIADAVSDRLEHLNLVANGGASRMRLVVTAKYALPASTGVASMVFYRGAALPALSGDLLLAADEGGYILRLQFDRRDASRIVASERLFEDRVGPVRALGISLRGEIYFCTPDALGRLLPP
jgi:glucose/arabinose dehydrogenase